MSEDSLKQHCLLYATPLVSTMHVQDILWACSIGRDGLYSYIFTIAKCCSATQLSRLQIFRSLQPGQLEIITLLLLTKCACGFRNLVMYRFSCILPYCMLVVC